MRLFGYICTLCSCSRRYPNREGGPLPVRTGCERSMGQHTAPPHLARECAQPGWRVPEWGRQTRRKVGRHPGGAHLSGNDMSERAGGLQAWTTLPGVSKLQSGLLPASRVQPPFSLHSVLYRTPRHVSPSVYEADGYCTVLHCTTLQYTYTY